MPEFGGVNTDIGNFGRDFGPLRRRPTPGAARVGRISADIFCYNDKGLLLLLIAWMIVGDQLILLKMRAWDAYADESSGCTSGESFIYDAQVTEDDAQSSVNYRFSTKLDNRFIEIRSIDETSTSLVSVIMENMMIIGSPSKDLQDDSSLHRASNCTYQLRHQSSKLESKHDPLEGVCVCVPSPILDIIDPITALPVFKVCQCVRRTKVWIRVFS